MVEVIALAGEKRDSAGKGAARALRRDGRVPAIIYGGKQGELNISLNARELVREYSKGNFTSHIVDLTVGKDTVRVLPREVQLDPVTDVPTHVDFQRLVKGEEIHVKVKVRFIKADLSPGIKRGGILNIVRRYVEFICDVDHIPKFITVDLEGKRIGESIHISHIELPKGVRPAIGDRDFTIATIAGRSAKDDAEESVIVSPSDVPAAHGGTPAAAPAAASKA